MSRTLWKKNLIGGTSNNSQAVLYTPTGRAQTNVKAELDRLNQNLTELLSSSGWTQNLDTDTNTLYPYIYTISTSIYNATSRPVWDCVGTSATGIPTDTELEAIALIQQAYFDTSGVTIYATDQPTVNVTFRAKGA